MVKGVNTTMSLENISGQEIFQESLSDKECLLKGDAPHKGALIRDLSAGIDFLADFWKEKYLQEYICEGGSKIKFITGKPGSGKSHFLRLFSLMAEEQHYKTVDFSAENIWLHDFKEIYLEILRQCNIMDCLRGCAGLVIEGMGYHQEDIPENMSFMDYLSSQDMGDAITRREIRLQLKKMFLENPLMDNNFALACSLLTGGILGHPLLETQNQELLLAWMQGDRTVKLALVRALGLSPSRITRYNARHMLRSLCEVIRISGYKGLIVSIDDMEILINRSGLAPLHYTKLRREDTYESIRQLIDEIDSLKNIMFLFGFDRELFDNDNMGIKSYQALWMRIQNEIVGEHFNRFADIADLDRLAVQAYSPDVLVSMSQRLAQAASSMECAAFVISPEDAEEIIQNAEFGGIGIPRLVNDRTLGGEYHV